MEGPNENEGKKVFVGGIPWAYTEQDLEAAFAPYGAVDEAKVIREPDGRSRGFAFVWLQDAGAADAAIAALHDQVRAAGARARPPRWTLKRKRSPCRPGHGWPARVRAPRRTSPTGGRTAARPGPALPQGQRWLPPRRLPAQGFPRRLPAT